MKINFKATNIELNESLRSYTIDKLAVVEKLLGHAQTVESESLVEA